MVNRDETSRNTPLPLLVSNIDHLYARFSHSMERPAIGGGVSKYILMLSNIFSNVCS